ncbi:MAG: hypothetical protein K6G11_10175, partial [Lachnospiraceae bacterium]|nr:hypothetical protein [Lachnospiraceae bacterium]
MRESDKNNIKNKQNVKTSQNTINVGKTDKSGKQKKQAAANTINVNNYSLGFNVKLTWDDFATLASEHVITNPDLQADDRIKNVQVYFASCRNDEDRIKFFLNLMDVNTHTWEFAAADELPIDINNSSDFDEVQNYLNENIDAMSVLAKAVLIKRLETLSKIRVIQEGSAGVKPRKGIYGKRPEVVVDSKNNRFEIKVNMFNPQTSTLGCYSTSMEMIVKSRGIENVTQENIRAHRTALSKQEKNSLTQNSTVNIQYTKDEMSSVLEKSDSIIAFAPNSMVRSFEILPKETLINDKTTNALNKISFNDYVDRATELVKEKIYQAVVVDKSPIAVTNSAHYITIVGMEGDDILFKDSRNIPCTQTDKVNLRNYVEQILSLGIPFVMTWGADIQLSKDGKTLYNVPSNYIRMDNDGNIEIPKVLAGDSHWSKSEMEKGGVRAGLFCGVDDMPFERENRDLTHDGVLTVEQVYLPKKVNLLYLRDQAKNRKNREEQELIDSTANLLGHNDLGKVPLGRPDYYKDEQKMRDLAAEKDLEKDIANREKRKNDKLNEYKIGTLGQFANNPEKAPSGKEYLWNNIGAIATFQLEMAYRATSCLLEQYGPEKNDKFLELRRRYEQLKNRLNAPENAIDENDMNKYEGIDIDENGYKISFPNGNISMNKFFKNEKDIYEAIMLIESIHDAFNFKNDFNVYSFRQVNMDKKNKTYNPTIFSACADNAQFISSFENGNLLRACASDPAIYNMLGTSVTLPDLDKNSLNTPIYTQNLNAQIKNYGELLFRLKQNSRHVMELQKHLGYNTFNANNLSNADKFMASFNSDIAMLSSNYKQLYENNNSNGKMKNTSEAIFNKTKGREVFPGMESCDKIGTSISIFQGEKLGFNINMNYSENGLIGYVFSLNIERNKRLGLKKNVNPELNSAINDIISFYNKNNAMMKYFRDRRAILAKDTLAKKLKDMYTKFEGDELLNDVILSKEHFNNCVDGIIKAADKALNRNVVNNQINVANNQINVINEPKNEIIEPKKEVKIEEKKVEAPKITEEKKVEAPKITEEKKVEAPKAIIKTEEKKVEAPKVAEEKKSEAPKVQQEQPKVEVTQTEAPKVEAPKTEEQPKIEVTQTEAPKTEEQPKIEVPETEVNNT